MGDGNLPLRKRGRNLNVRRVAWVVGLLVVFFACGIAAGAWMLLSRVYDPSTKPEASQGQPVASRINILIMGLDAGVNGLGKPSSPTVHTSRTDTMMVLSLDPEFKNAGIISIPRDTRVRIPGRTGFDKINHAHAYGGPKLAMEAAAALLGEEIPYYLRVDFKGFVKMVDMIGGVEMNIEHDMDYDDPYQDLHIHLKAGKQVLNGEKSLQFVRYRQYPEGDIGRVKAQQKFISALVKSFFDMNTLWKIPNLASEAVQYVDTNIDPAMMVSIANLARQIKREDIRMDLVPGQPADYSDVTGTAISYWVADQSQLKKCVDLLIRGIDREANSKVRVEVLNGTGVAGLAERVAKNLRDLGYLVVKVDNAPKAANGPTEVTGSAANVMAVKSVCRQVLKFSPEAVIEKRPAGEEADVSVILGADCKPE
ncbi:MAG: LCP family protein [Ignavibacteriales bacterium]